MSERKDRKLMELNKDLAQFKKRSKQLIRLEDNIIGLVDENKTLRSVNSNKRLWKRQGMR